MTNFYRLVPKDPEKNLRYRLNLRRRASKDVKFRRKMQAACKADCLFWINSFCYLYEPRPRFHPNGKRKSTMIPAITWEHQDPVVLECKKWLGICDVGVEKARGEGMSWLALLMALHEWLYWPGSKIGVVSKDEITADDPGNMDSLMAKLDWELTRLPKWMVGVQDSDWTRNKTEHSLVNFRTGCQINAFAATKNAGRAGRYTWFLCDELGFWNRPQDDRFLESIRSSTDSRLFVSTPNGTDGAYYRVMHAPSNMKKMVLDWKQNPYRNRGLYRLERGKPVAVDPENNPLPKHYDPPTREVLEMFVRLRDKGFVLEKGERSPWFDNECDKADADPRSIARELGRDYGGSMARVFQSSFFDELEKTVCKPYAEGFLDYDPETLEPDFEYANEGDRGDVKLWMRLDHKRRPPLHQYVVACDIGAGGGGSHTSNSTIEAFDLVTGEQVLEIAKNTVEPSDWADLAIAVAKWLYDAYLGWEINGPGSQFTNHINERKYANVYYRTKVNKRTKKKTKDLGWHTGKDSKEVLFKGIAHGVKRGTLVIHSKDAARECGEYVRDSKAGAIVHHGAKGQEDGQAAGEAHGDRVIGIGVARQLMLDRPLWEIKEALDGAINGNREYSGDPPPHTLAARQREYEENLKKEDDPWDDRTNDMLAKQLSLR